MLCGEEQRRIAVDAGRSAHVRAGIQQHLRERRVIVHGGPVERGHPITLRGVDVASLLQQCTHGGRVPLHGGVGHRRGTVPGESD
jgi:hypothetical protein